MDLASDTILPYSDEEWSEKLPFFQEVTFHLYNYQSGDTFDEEPSYIAARNLNIHIVKVDNAGFDYSVTVKCENLGDLYHLGIEHTLQEARKKSAIEILQSEPEDEKGAILKARLLRMELTGDYFESLRPIAEEYVNKYESQLPLLKQYPSREHNK